MKRNWSRAAFASVCAAMWDPHRGRRRPREPKALRLFYTGKQAVRSPRYRGAKVAPFRWIGASLWMQSSSVWTERITLIRSFYIIWNIHCASYIAELQSITQKCKSDILTMFSKNCQSFDWDLKLKFKPHCVQFSCVNQRKVLTHFHIWGIKHFISKNFLQWLNQLGANGIKLKKNPIPKWLHATSHQILSCPNLFSSSPSDQSQNELQAGSLLPPLQTLLHLPWETHLWCLATWRALCYSGGKHSRVILTLCSIAPLCLCELVKVLDVAHDTNDGDWAQDENIFHLTLSFKHVWPGRENVLLQWRSSASVKTGFY